MASSNFKPTKPKKDLLFLMAVRERNCIICETFHEPQMSPTAAHHVIHDRFSNRKTCDTLAIPLCEGHHQGMFDTSKVAIHREPLKWRKLYGSDHSYSDPSSH
jgi:hypothetical protein